VARCAIAPCAVCEVSSVSPPRCVTIRLTPTLIGIVAVPMPLGRPWSYAAQRKPGARAGSGECVMLKWCLVAVMIGWAGVAAARVGNGRDIPQADS
jgi:hypothetical protein